jgi:hypothetical protein
MAIIDGSLRVDNLPEGTRFIRAFIDQYTNALCFIIEHDSFDEVPEGDSVPWLPASYSVNFKTIE